MRHSPTVPAARRALALAPVLLLALVPLPAGCRRGEPPRPAAVAPDTGLRAPESALWDSGSGVWLVSNVNGAPLARDDNGFISRMDVQGRPLLWRWIDGADTAVALDAPKGMAIRGDTLFVADIGVVRLFHRVTGRPLGERPVPGATFLNDVAVGPDGTVYVTDSGLRLGASGEERSGTDAVWRFDARGVAQAVAKDTSLGGPNGVLAERGGITVVTLGSGAVYRLDARGRRTDLPRPPEGALDGVVRANDGALLVSSWEGRAVYRLKGNGPWTTAVDSVESPADIGWDRERGTLAIPQMMRDRLIVRTLR
jgi:sugar lactone lactonase YvrE